MQNTEKEESVAHTVHSVNIGRGCQNCFFFSSYFVVAIHVNSGILAVNTSLEIECFCLHEF